MSDVSGSFSYMSPDVGYVHDVDCFWVLRTEEGKVNSAIQKVHFIRVCECVVCVDIS